MTGGITIQDAAERTGLSAYTLRYYERIGLLDAPARMPSGHRRYTERDVDWLVFLTRLRATGMPIAGMLRYAELVRSGPHTGPERLALLEAHRAEVAARIAGLTADLELIDYKITTYRRGTCGGTDSQMESHA
jgi:DNA-binding transcriptional MerR regulator